MDGFSAAVTAGTAVDFAAKIVSSCWDYYNAVKSARRDIERLRIEVLAFHEVAKQLEDLLRGPLDKEFRISEPVLSSVKQCRDDLTDLDQRLQPGKIRKFGITALKWPLSSKEVDKIITVLKRHELSFNTFLNLNQMKVVVDLEKKVDHDRQERYLAMLPRAKSASFNSFTWQHQPICHQETRVELLQEVRDWANSADGKCVYWLNGMAGTGKSTIARTLARQMYDDGCLSGSFFFSRGGGELTKAEKLWSTLAYSLAKKSSLLLNYICEAIRTQNDIGYQGLREQWKRLIHDPLTSLDAEVRQRYNHIFVIDALDECDSEEDVGTILELLSLAKSLKIVRLRVFITSRPELHIRLGFSSMPHIVYRDLILHNVDRTVVNHDIRIFLRDELAKIRVKRKVSTGWPDAVAIDKLVERANCLFIYAATACRYVGESRRIAPEKRLNSLLTGSSSGLTAERSLDKIYLEILESSLVVEYSEHELTELSEQFRLIVGVIVLLEDPLSADSLAMLLEGSLAQFVEGKASIRSLVDSTVDPFTSLLNVPADPASPIRILHPSFRDFLIDKDRCTNGHFHVDRESLHCELFKACLRVIKYDLKPNCLHSVKPGILHSNIDGASVRRSIPPHVQYACRYWIRHGGYNDETMEAQSMSSFLNKYVLQWLEVVLLLGQLSDIILQFKTTELLERTRRQINQDTYWAICDLIRFIRNHRSTIESAPYQLYSSAVLRSPQDSFIRKQYLNHLPAWIKTVPIVERTWDASLQTFETHSGDKEVIDMAVSLDGRLIITGSKDGLVRIWDLHRESLETVLLGHRSAVQTVAISSTLKTVLSGSKDGTARIWDVKTGTCLHVLECYKTVVQKIMISANEAVVFTGAQDGYVRLWDPSSGTLLATFLSEAGAITDLALSPNDEFLAAGTYDGAVLVWDPIARSLLSRLQSHKSAVNTVLFSDGPRGLIVASGSYDRTVKIWSVPTRELLFTLSGHTRLVKSIACSRSGALLASASFDNTIKVWETESGKLLGTLKGHRDALICVAFSKNRENLLASAGKDRTVRIWDATEPKLTSIFEGHSRTVNAVVWAPQSDKSELLASASRDCTIRVWDPTETGIDVDTHVVSHRDDVNGVEISPNGCLLATRSKDKSVMLWSAVTGDPVRTFEGHTDWVSALAFSPDSRTIASGAHDNNVFLYDVDGRSEIMMSGHSRAIVNVLFSPDNAKVGSYAYDRTIKVWDRQGQMLCNFEQHTRQINAIQFSLDSTRLASASYDLTVGVHDVESQILQHTLKGHIRSVDAVCFSPDGTAIVSGSKDRTLKVWDAIHGQLKKTLRDHEETIATVLFSQDGTKIISCTGRSVKIWDTASGELLRTQNNVAPFVLDMNSTARWSSDGLMLVKQAAPGLPADQIGYRYSRIMLRLSTSDVVEASQPPTISVNTANETENHFAVSANLQWITHDGENVLFLPGFLRPRVFVINGETIVLGNGTGRVMLFGFDHRYFVGTQKICRTIHEQL